MVRVFAKIDESPDIARHGQVMTKPHIVRLILDLSGYTADRPLQEMRFLEPSCGDGEFVIEAVRRLLASVDEADACSLGDSIRAVEKDDRLAEIARARIVELLVLERMNKRSAVSLAKKWIVTDDFLRADLPSDFDFVIGNPPYVRQEAMSQEDLDFCREQMTCFYDRADLYMAFLERGLRLLSDKGALAYICPNRFTRNRYGAPLRDMIATEYQVTHAIDLPNASPFVPEVMAYPGIYVIKRGKQGPVQFFTMKDATEAETDRVLAIVEATSKDDSKSFRKSNGVGYHRYDEWFGKGEPWATESPAHLAIVRKLEKQFPPLGSPESGTKVGIGVASGADRVFIVGPDFDQVEPELLVPLALARDCANGQLAWSGHSIINPFAKNGRGLIDLDEYPRAKRYFESHSAQIKGRNVAKRSGDGWYRTIDRITPSLLKQPKLLIPDIKADSAIAYDKGTVYPHHNLYFITAEYWDLLALRTLIRSSIAKFFVWMYGVKMRGGFLRFQAQYLRRIPVPSPLSISDEAIAGLLAANETDDVKVIDAAAAVAYGIGSKELRVIQKTVS